jgi:hypothetical protein
MCNACNGYNDYIKNVGKRRKNRLCKGTTSQGPKTKRSLLLWWRDSLQQLPTDWRASRNFGILLSELLQGARAMTPADENTRNVRLSIGNYKRLEALGKKQDTFDDIIGRVLDQVGA